MKDKAVIFVDSADFSTPSAPLFRYLAIMRGLCENGVNVYWFLLYAGPTKEILSDPYYNKIIFIHPSKKMTAFKNNKLIAYLYKFTYIYKVKPLINNLKTKYKQVICLTHGDNFFPDYILAKLCRRNKIKIYNEMTEYPKLLNKDLGWIKKMRIYIRSKLYLNYYIFEMDHIFVISNALKHFFDTHNKQYNKKIPVSILNMVVEPDRYRCSDSSIDSQYKDIVYVGTMYGDKDGVYYLLEAFLKIYQDYPDSRLILIGDNTRTSRMQKINQIMNHNSDSDRIIFTGQLDRKGVIEKINSAYCLVLSRPNNIQAKYGFPTKLGEYLSTGKPVIVTSVGDIPLFLKDGENAYISKPDDVASFANKLNDCLSDPFKASYIGKKGEELVYREFNYLEVTAHIVYSM